jgi:hypothetical protein
MRLARCEKKCCDGSASDFECFREWIFLLPQLEGNESAERFAARLSDILGVEMSVRELACCDPKHLWERCNALLHGIEYVRENSVEKEKMCSCKRKEIVCDEKFQYIDSYTDIYTAVTEALAQGLSTLENIVDFIEKYTDRRIIYTCPNKNFSRPDRFHAQKGIEQIRTDEKEYLDILMCQIICELCYLFESGKIQLILDPDGNMDYASDMIGYLNSRELNAEIFLLTNSSDRAEEIVRICLESGEHCTAVPLVCNDDAGISCADTLARFYPRGMICFAKKSDNLI